VEDEGIISTERKRELLGVILLLVTGVLFSALLSDLLYSNQNAELTAEGPVATPNWLGPVGAFIAGTLSVLFGDAAHLIYGITFFWALKQCVHKPFGRVLTRIAGLVLLVGAMAGLLHIHLLKGVADAQSGGALGAFVAESLLLPRFGIIAASILCGIATLIGMLLATDFLFIHFFVFIHRILLGIGRGVWFLLSGVWRVFLWLTGTDTQSVSRDTEEAFAPISDFCEQIPESAFPPAPKEKKRGLFARAVALLVPRVSHKTLIPEEVEDDGADTGYEPDTDFDENVFPSEVTVPRKPPRLHIREITEEQSDAADAPFGEIPVLNLSDTGEGEQRDMFVDLLPTQDIPVSPEGASPGAGVSKVEEDAEDVDGLSVSLRHDSAAAKAVNSKRGQHRLRRKIEKVEDLPEDYEYPARYTPPPLDLFERVERRIIPNLREKMGKMAAHLEDTLATFNIEAKVTDVTRGPTITRFELEPAPGTKVSRFQGLTDDIALALKAKGVRVEAPIPGKGRVGIEISNEERDPVVVRELLEHSVFSTRGGRLNLALGKDIAGEVCIADLMRMPHLLVAGATGAGKTVCIKALLASLLYQHTPDELQLMLIDPKMVELSIFNDIPHLITPVVTDPKKAAASLQWLINEMEERYRLFADLRVRNIEVYNASVENGEIEMEGGQGQHKSHSVNVVRKLPFIVCIIDELADLMILARSEVEEAIMRLAQLARAVGIHLIIATQRPSVDVLTGVIKANFPARISFQVSSRVDSRCILDEIGAERLIGMGDMLYLPAGQSKPARIQGAFVSDEEMSALIAYLKRQAPPQYRDEIQNFGKTKETMEDLDQEDDPLLEDAIRVVLDTGQASISMVQRRLRVGYTRAARLIDMMELKGIVGPHTGSKAREILVATTMKE